MNNSDFFIGWQPKAPEGYSRQVRKSIIFISLLVIITGVVLSLQQRSFSTARFEYGQLTEVKGIYQQFPVPSIKVTTKSDAFGRNSFITIPLVGYGKFGAVGTIESIEKEKNIRLTNKEVSMKGTLIYSDGKSLLQIDKNDDPLVTVSSETIIGNTPSKIELGTVQLTGEILDPKCYFGVMKPGHGKPHRDCAVRCIAGGISPVFYVYNEKGETDYYLILGPDGKKINNEIKDFVGEPVSLEARAVQYDDWVVLYVNDTKSIRRTGGLSWFKAKDGAILCRPSVTK